jgi:hypothetical protein
MSWLKILWSGNVYWPTLIIVGFGLREGIALGTGRPQDTLSDWVWRVCDVMPGQTLWEWSAVHFFLLLLMVWLFFHFDFRWFT